VLTSTGSPVPLIEPQSAWNVRLGRRIGGIYLDVLQCGNTMLKLAGECT